MSSIRMEYTYPRELEKAKAEFDYLEEVARSYGFDGFIFISNGDTAEIEKYGMEGYAAYHWGASGYQYNVNVDKNIERAKTTTTSYVIPTISVGLDDFAWRGAKMPLMSTEDW